MGAVRRLAAFMSSLPPGEHPPAFARHGVCIIENFQPFLFCGPDAVGRWEAGFRAHSAEEGLSNLTAAFGDPWDFNRSGGHAYFSLPTTWTGLTHGRPFEEHGAWAFVLAKEPDGWRIESYGWGVTSYVEGGAEN